jgi:hypothetical protein
MKNCFDCKAELSEGAAFCHKCGGQVTSQPVQPGSARNRRTRPSAELTAKSKAEHAEIRASIVAAFGLRSFQVLFFFIVSSALLTLVWLNTPGPTNIGHIGAAFAILVLTSKFMGRDRWLTQEEYYSITGSRDPDGQHRCIFCGNHGIYRQGEYAGNTTYAQCSKCKEPLFFH